MFCMKELMIFNAEDVSVVDPRAHKNYSKDRERISERSKDKLDLFFKEQSTLSHLKIDYPIFALFMNYQEGMDEICAARKGRRDGIRVGAIRYWSDDYDASTPTGLAKAIDKERSITPSDFKWNNPITCVIDFIGNNSITKDAYKILESKYGYKLSREPAKF